MPPEIPLIARLSHEVPKPKDWQALQRGCTILFKAELADPTAQAFGRNGQDQGGIDILGRRDGRIDHRVGIQCRLIAKRDKESKVLADCREAVALGLGIKEMIFATTAPDDVAATHVADRVERRLRAEGHDVTVTIQGWGALQDLIATHPVAYNAFFPAAVSSSASWAAIPAHSEAEAMAVRIAERLVLLGVSGPPRESAGEDLTDEDPRLHARIDAYRDLFKEQGQTLAAQRALLRLLEGDDVGSKPWARFRIETNLGGIAMDLGRTEEAAARFEAAHALRPTDPEAVARLALARLLRGRHGEAMDLARSALSGSEPAEYAVGVLLHAAARSDWSGDPEELVPDAFAGTGAADLGVAEFLRLRAEPDWARRSLAIAERHADMPEFRRVRGLATLEVLVTSGALVPGGRGPLSPEVVERAAEDLRATAEHCLAVGYADAHDLAAYLNNAGALLRLAGRHADCEALLRRGVERLPYDPHVRRQLALALAAQDRRPDALRTLSGDGDTENALLAAELTAVDDPRRALSMATLVDARSLTPEASRLRARLLGEIGLRLEDGALVGLAAAELRALVPADRTADLLEIDWDARHGAERDEVAGRLRAVVEALPAGAGAAERYLLASALREHDLPAEAASLLEGCVDVTRPGPATTLYVQCLAAARRDDAFRAAVASSREMERDPDVLWSMATHAWNVGDLAEAERSVDRLIEVRPDDGGARHLRIEVLIRANKTSEVLAELAGPVEALPGLGMGKRCRLASLLGHFGHRERGAALAYELFLENRDASQAWMTLAGLVLEAGRADRAPPAWSPASVTEDAAIDVRFDDGETAFVVVEPDPGMRRLDDQSWEPDHPSVRALMGLPVGGRFARGDGRGGVVVQIRHKYVARLHHVLANHQARFPEVNGFRSIAVGVDQPDGLAALIRELRARSDWFDDEHGAYLTGPLPLGALATRLGLDTIETAGSLAAAGRTLKVAEGNEPERAVAAAAVARNRRRGCVLDLLAFWTAWRLSALEAITATCGPVHLPRSVVDRLHARREQIASLVSTGKRTVGTRDGSVIVEEAPRELVQGWLEDVVRALAWIEAEASVEPVVVGDDLPEALREHLRIGRGDLFDALVVSSRRDVLLVTDDEPVRRIARGLGFTSSTWLHQILTTALERGVAPVDAYVRWSAELIEAGHDFIGISGPVLARAARMDAAAGRVPGRFLSAVSRPIGGRAAEPRSHALAVAVCVLDLWTGGEAAPYRHRVTDLLLTRLTRERVDHGSVLAGLATMAAGCPPAAGYVRAWARGHFIRMPDA